MQLITPLTCPLDVTAFDQLVRCMNHGSATEASYAQKSLTDLLHEPRAWEAVGDVVQADVSPEAKFVALTILQHTINTRWQALSVDQQGAVRRWLLGTLADLTGDGGRYARERLLVQKLQTVLVDVAKQDWPERWPGLLPDLVGLPTGPAPACHHRLTVLARLSEEVFEYRSASLPRAKVAHLQRCLRAEAGPVLAFVLTVLRQSDDPDLLLQGLHTLNTLVTWLPEALVFEPPLVAVLGGKFLSPDYPAQQPHATLALYCLRELAKAPSVVGMDQWTNVYEQMLLGVVAYLDKALAIPHHPAAFVEQYPQRVQADADFEFATAACLFLTTFLTHHLPLVEDGHPQCVLHAYLHLLGLTNLQAEESFKPCVDFWAFLAERVFFSNPGVIPFTPSDDEEGPLQELFEKPAVVYMTRRTEVLDELRGLLIRRMVKPKEVIVTQNEDGEVVRQELQDNEGDALYGAMRACLVYLTHLDAPRTERTMLDLIHTAVRQPPTSDAGWAEVHSLCWAIGAIAGVMSAELEHTFAETVIVALTDLCAATQHHPGAALVQADLLYVCGQYPRLLRRNPPFLRTVVTHIVSFLHCQASPALQDMALDTLRTIGRRCHVVFFHTIASQVPNVVEVLLQDWASITSDLQPQQVLAAYEAMGYVLRALDAVQADPHLTRLLQGPDAKWRAAVDTLRVSAAALYDPALLHDVALALELRVQLAKPLGSTMLAFCEPHFRDYLGVYATCSEATQRHQPAPGQQELPLHIHAARRVKRAVLRLFKELIMRAEDPSFIQTSLLADLPAVVLPDYARAPPPLREAAVLPLLAVIVEQVGLFFREEVQTVMELAVFETFAMLRHNFDDFPDHRIHFYFLLHLLVVRRSALLLQLFLNDERLRDALLWGIQHPDHRPADLALQSLQSLVWAALEDDGALRRFAEGRYLTVLHATLRVTTDSFHRASLERQTQLLHLLMEFSAYLPPDVRLSTDQPPEVTPGDFLRVHLKQWLLVVAQATHSEAAVERVVHGLFCRRGGEFSQHVQDFVISLASCQSEDAFPQRPDAAQVRPTRPVPGLAPPPAEEDLLDIFRGLNLQDEVPSWGAFPHDTPPG